MGNPVARRVRWKNLLCRVCEMWVDRERLVEHARTPKHVRAMRGGRRA